MSTTRQPKQHVATTRHRLPQTDDRRTYLLDEPVNRPRPLSTFGFPLSAADEHDLQWHLAHLRGTPNVSEDQLKTSMLAFRRDLAIAQAGHRWQGEPLTSRNVEYVPGDVCGLRASAFQGSFQATAGLFQHPDRHPDPDSAEYLRYELAQAAYVYDAVPYFIPALTSLGIAGSEPPSPELLGELRLPFPRIAIFFGADLALPPTLTGGEEILKDRIRYHDDQLRQASTEVVAHRMPPVQIHAALLGLHRKFPVCLVGVLLAAGPDGLGLDDLAMWFTTTDLSKGGVTRRVDPGFLSSARLAVVAHNLAAAIAWGPWKTSDRPLELPADSESKAFREALRRGQFRRREPSGAAAEVWIIDVKPPHAEPRSEGESTHASPVTHLRRGHTRRQRVGPHDNWRYETRWINPVVVNPQFAPGPGNVTVYRLPDPSRT